MKTFSKITFAFLALVLAILCSFLTSCDSSTINEPSDDSNDNNNSIDSSATCEHSYSNWRTVSEATCTVDGVKERSCILCNNVETDTIPACHDFGAWNTSASPTCTEKGTETRTCSICLETENRTLDKIAHTESQWIVDETPTCLKKGTQHTQCTVCKTTMQNSTISALGHKAQNAVIENETKATCVKKGSYDSVVYCETCNAEMSRTTKTSPITTTHNYVTQTIAATCSAPGGIENICTDCKKCIWTDLTAPTTHQSIFSCSKCDYNAYNQFAALLAKKGSYSSDDSAYIYDISTKTTYEKIQIRMWYYPSSSTIKIRYVDQQYTSSIHTNSYRKLAFTFDFSITSTAQNTYDFYSTLISGGSATAEGHFNASDITDFPSTLSFSNYGALFAPSDARSYMENASHVALRYILSNLNTFLTSNTYDVNMRSFGFTNYPLEHSHTYTVTVITAPTSTSSGKIRCVCSECNFKTDTITVPPLVPTSFTSSSDET